MARQTLGERLGKLEEMMQNHLKHHQMVLTRFILPTLVGVILAVVGIGFVVFQQIILRLLQ